MLSVEDLTDSAITALVAGLDAALTAIEAKYAGGPYDLGPLERPRFERGQDGNPTGDLYAGGVGQVTRWPSIEVAVPDLSGDSFSLDWQDSDVTPTLVVRTWVSDPKFWHLYRKACRYGAAVYNVLASPDEATERGSGFGADVGIRRYVSRWRFNPDTNTRDEVESAVLQFFYLDAPDVRP